MSARPPIKAAHEAATKRLVNEESERWQQYVTEELAKAGWAQREVTVKKWTRDGTG